MTRIRKNRSGEAAAAASRSVNPSGGGSSRAQEGSRGAADPSAAGPSSAGGERGRRHSQHGIRRRYLAAVGLVLLLGGAIVGARYYEYAISHASTDDASIQGHVIEISPQVPGHVLTVNVTDNQMVKRGDLLLVIDPRDSEARLAQARANLAAAIAGEKQASLGVGLTQTTSSAGVQEASAGVEAARAHVVAARSRLAQAQAQVQMAVADAAQARAQIAAAQADATRTGEDVRRYRRLYAERGISRQQLDYAVAAAQAATAQLEAARKRAAAAAAQVRDARAAAHASADALHQAEAQVGEAQGRLAAANAAPRQVAISQAQAERSRAEITQAEAAVKEAELALSYTKVYAPTSGRITNKAVEPGDYVQVGQALMAIVPDDVWVIANFKETQLDYIRPGQPVDVYVDAYPGRVFKGHVDSIQSGTDAQFSLLPPENATGNFVKVVQRVPVKIVFDGPPDPSYPLGPGMSVVPEVRIR